MIDYKTHPIKSLYMHVGVYIGSHCTLSFRRQDGYSFTVVPEGVLVETPKVGSHNLQPGYFALVPWSNLHGVAYEPETAVPAPTAPIPAEVTSAARPKSKSR